MKGLGKFCLMLCMGLIGHGCSSTDGNRNQLLLRAELMNIINDYEMPGMTAAAVWADGSQVVAAVGEADRERGQAMTVESRMLAASIGKSFVAVIALALADEGQLDLDQPIRYWLSDCEWFKHLPNHEAITMRHLLNHSAGLPDHVHHEAFARLMAEVGLEHLDRLQPEMLIGLIADEKPLFPAGQGWSYSDTGYLIAGLVIEAASGQPYETLLDEMVLRPLLLSATEPSNRRRMANLANGYTTTDNALGLPPSALDDQGVMRWHPAVEWTGGGLVSTSADLAQWGHALFGGKVLNSDYRTPLLRWIPVAQQQQGHYYGLGVSMSLGGPWGPVYGHAGWVPGYVSSLRHYPDYGLTVAFQINDDRTIVMHHEDILGQLEGRLVKALLSAVPEEPQRTAVQRPRPLPETH